MHVALEVNSENNKLATEFTPENLRITKVFTALNPAYRPENNNGIVPKDFSYYPPTASDTQEDLDNYNKDHGIDLNNPDETVDWSDIITDITNRNNNNNSDNNNKHHNNNNDTGSEDDGDVKILP